jgi:curved DNA-binding protein CbpA
MHPDKLAQRGLTVGAKEQAEFARIKDAHAILSDPTRRQGGGVSSGWKKRMLSVIYHK